MSNLSCNITVSIGSTRAKLGHNASRKNTISGATRSIVQRGNCLGFCTASCPFFTCLHATKKREKQFFYFLVLYYCRYERDRHCQRCLARAQETGEKCDDGWQEKEERRWQKEEENRRKCLRSFVGIQVCLFDRQIIDSSVSVSSQGFRWSTRNWKNGVFEYTSWTRTTKYWWVAMLISVRNVPLRWDI